MPLAHFLKNFFSGEKKFGSKDRKQIAQLCYAYYRLGKDFTDLSFEQRILLGLRTTADAAAVAWEPLFEAYQVPQHFSGTVFPWKKQLSPSVDAALLEQSFLTQPDLFLRIRPGNEAGVKQKLEAAGISFKLEGDAIRLNNAVKADTVLDINREVVVQDLSSQQTAGLLRFFKTLKAHPDSYRGSTLQSPISIWDCCAASGGKSLLAWDVLAPAELTVSDLRSSIIANLKRRFREAGITSFNALVADATMSPAPHFRAHFDLVIADVPCSGSGTWSRTPERLHYFNTSEIKTYATLQRKILTNLGHAVKPGGFLLYITCSVFHAENEDQVAWLQQRGWKVKEQQVIKGYTLKADTMFGALLQKEQ
ncbi:Fmu (Sun) domain protein [Niabella sp. 3A5MI-3]|nr:Fmu (Sun) domain protein [Niabella beijingensis]